MSDQTADFTGTTGAAAEGGPQLRVLTQYIKDMSFENPNVPAPARAARRTAPDRRARRCRVRASASTDFEITLSIGVDAKHKTDTMFLVELQYAGLFRLTNIPADSLEPVLVIECPRQIFPFARRIIADATRDGGFPPLMIDPIDFVHLYQQRRGEAEAAAASGAKPN